MWNIFTQFHHLTVQIAGCLFHTTWYLNQLGYISCFASCQEQHLKSYTHSGQTGLVWAMQWRWWWGWWYVYGFIRSWTWAEHQVSKVNNSSLSLKSTDIPFNRDEDSSSSLSHTPLSPSRRGRSDVNPSPYPHHGLIGGEDLGLCVLLLVKNNHSSGHYIYSTSYFNWCNRVSAERRGRRPTKNSAQWMRRDSHKTPLHSEKSSELVTNKVV